METEGQSVYLQFNTFPNLLTPMKKIPPPPLMQFTRQQQQRPKSFRKFGFYV